MSQLEDLMRWPHTMSQIAEVMKNSGATIIQVECDNQLTADEMELIASNATVIPFKQPPELISMRVQTRDGLYTMSGRATGRLILITQIIKAKDD